MKLEIERKWLLRRMPELPAAGGPYETVEIQQGYIETPQVLLRVRRADKAYFLTVKGSGSVARAEWEESIPYWTYKYLMDGSNHSLKKVRTVVSEGPPELVIDRHTGVLEGLVLVEAEWKADDTNPEHLKAVRMACSTYRLPDWMGEAREVSQDPAYKAASLSWAGKLPNDWRD